MAKSHETLSSVHNAIRILREFSQDTPDLGVTELSRRLGLSKSSVFRLTRTLRDAQLLQKNQKTRKHHLGLTAFEIGAVVYHKMEICQVARPLLEKMMRIV